MSNHTHKKSRKLNVIDWVYITVFLSMVIGATILLLLPDSITAMQSEAQTTLQQIYNMEQAYFQQNGSYWSGGPASSTNPNALSTLGVKIGPTARYSYAIVVSKNAFTATATANLDDDEAIDTWTIDQDRKLLCWTNDAEQ